jgi:tetratricopeptide (TPR) repeat protein
MRPQDAALAGDGQAEYGWGNTDEAGVSNRGAPRVPRPVVWLAALACAALAWVGVELSRQTAESLPAPTAAVPPPLASGFPLRPTPDQLVDEARQLAQQLLTAFPHEPSAWLLAGRIYYAFNDVPRAYECWDRCLAVDPEDVQTRGAMAEAAWEHGEFARAAEHVQRVTKTHPEVDPKLLYFLADSLMNLGRLPEAVQVLEAAARRQPLSPFGQFLLAQAYLQAGDYEQARTHFAALLEADPAAINAHYGLATAYTRLGQPEAARRHRELYAQLRQGELAESARLRPEMRRADWADPLPVVREAYLNAGKLWANTGQPAAAERLWLRAVELDPQHPPARSLLQLLYARQGREADAARLPGRPASAP